MLILILFCAICAKLHKERMGRAKEAKRKPQGKGLRNELDIDQKLAIQRLKAQGRKKKDILIKLNLEGMANSSFYKIVNADLTNIPPSHNYRQKRSDVDYPLNHQFEQEAVDHFSAKNQDGRFGSNGLYMALLDTQKKAEYQADARIAGLVFSNDYIRRLRTNFDLVVTDRKSNSHHFCESELNDFRDGIRLQFGDTRPEFILNTDETGVQYNAMQSRALRHKDQKYKIVNERCRFTFLPVIGFQHDRLIIPAIISKNKGSRWNLVRRHKETVRVKVMVTEENKVTKKKTKKVKTVEVERFHCTDKNKNKFVLYTQKSAWMVSAIWASECERWSRHLARVAPGRTFILLVDNCPSHKCLTEYPNLKVQMLPANSTSHLQPADLLLNAVLKSTYRKKLTEKLWSIPVGSNRSLTEKEGIELLLKSYSGITQNVKDRSFQKMKMGSFFGQPVESDVEEEEEEIDQFAIAEWDVPPDLVI